MAKDCERCTYKSGYAHPKCGTCMVNYINGVQQDLPSNFKQKSITNANRIRAMSDEELAHELSLVAGWDRKQYRRAKSIGIDKVMLEWLRQPVGDKYHEID